MILTNARILTFDAANHVLDSGSVAGRKMPAHSGTHRKDAAMILTNARILTFDAANRVLDSGSAVGRKMPGHSGTHIVGTRP